MTPTQRRACLHAGFFGLLAVLNATANSVPVAIPQGIGTLANQPKAISLSATDADGDALTYAIVSAPFRGQLVGTPPALTYVPGTNFTGTDNFWFTASDGTSTSAPALVAIGINAIGNQPPVVTWTGAANGSQFTAPASLNLAAIATDVDGSIDRVDFLLGFDALISSTNSPFAATWTGVPAGTYTLSAKARDNGGSRTYSTPVVVTVAGAGLPVTLTVNGGTGGGSYPAGTAVPIAAPVVAGKTFSSWTGTGIANATAAFTVIQLPTTNVSVTAVYKSATPPPPASTYMLTVINGTGGGQYSPGTTVNLSAAPAPVGKVFQQWAGAAVTSPTSPSTTLAMPAAATTVTATYATLSPVALTVINGTGSGSYLPGSQIAVTANPPAPGVSFSQWTGASVASPAAPITTVIMPSTATTLTANYATLPSPAPVAGITNPILFVAQIPIGFDFTTIGSAFGNHKPTTDSAGRGGDLYIRYPDGSLKNLTAAAGYGVASGFQGTNGIAVRDPSVHWDGTRAVFSMVVGSGAVAFQTPTNYWQLYEISGLGQGENPVITRVSNQPATYNNVSPCYGTDGRILFTSDRPRGGQAHLYPQLDEYELAPTVSGLWSLDPGTGNLFQLDHAPSGAFTPFVDSFGRVIFTRWDHLQQDQEADLDRDAIAKGLSIPFGVFNYSDESSTAKVLAGNTTEVFPESRLVSGFVNGHVFNFFFPWMINEDGTEEETLNHVGRHEIGGYLEPSLLNDNSLGYFYNTSLRFNNAVSDHFFHIAEDPKQPGLYYGTDAPEFGTHSAGQILTLNGPVGLDADHMANTYITHPETKSFTSTPTTNHSGLYRNPLPLSSGPLIAAHTTNTANESRRGVSSDYQFQLKTLKQAGTYWVADKPLTSGLSKSVTFYGYGGGLVSYSGPLWELSPVEVRARPIPAHAHAPLGAPEQQVLDEEGVDATVLSSYLRQNNLALVVSRNVTTRDHADRQQPFNLRIAGTTNKTTGTGGKLYDIAFLQFFQGDQIRGFGLYTTNSTPRAGRRVLAQPMHDSSALANNPVDPTVPAGAVKLGVDGSMAAFVPAQRALTWQLSDTNGGAVVRERFWLTFQPGEIRTCTSCHGVNTKDQANHPAPTNKPEALRSLLQGLKATVNLSASSAVGSALPEPGRITLNLSAQPSTSYRLEASPDLRHWTTVGRYTTDDSGRLRVHLQDVSASAGRYYRLAE